MSFVSVSIDFEYDDVIRSRNKLRVQSLVSKAENFSTFNASMYVSANQIGCICVAVDINDVSFISELLQPMLSNVANVANQNSQLLSSRSWLPSLCLLLFIDGKVASKLVTSS